MSARTVLITGASRGIGAAIADAFAARGDFVVGTATSAAGAEAIAARLGARGRGLVLDVADPAAIEAVVNRVEQEHGGVAVLVNNAGITRDGLALRTKDADWAAVLDTNLGGAFRMARACLRGMLKRRQGRVISVGSVIGAIGNPGQANYAAAKAGLVGMSKALAREVASRGITVNVVAPGFIETDMTAALNEAQRHAMAEQIPLARLGRPADVAHAVLFLASDEAGYITGETLHVNGGMYMA